MMSVSSLWFSGNVLVVRSDNTATDVSIQRVGASVRISDIGTNRNWSYAAAQVQGVEFQGGNGNDRLVNQAANLWVRAFGFGGDDSLEGSDIGDALVGGNGNDRLVGNGGNDAFHGGDGNDVLLGMAGADGFMGGSGDDRLEGGEGNDAIHGEAGDDVLLGGAGDDALMGGDGGDRLNGGAGLDRMWGQDGDDSLIAIDGAATDLMQGDAGRDTIWIEQAGPSSDATFGLTVEDRLQSVAGFANGADLTLDGDRITDPTTDAGQTYRRFAGNPLFGSAGPRMTDVRQGYLGDCYLLAALAAIAADSPHAIRRNVVEFDDGTYGVRYGDAFYRVDDDLPVHGTTGLSPAYAALGAQNSMWVAIYEKAFAHHRTGENTYASIEGGWSVEVNRAFGSTAAGARSIAGYGTAAALASDLFSRWSAGQAVTIGFLGRRAGGSDAPLIMGHMYSVAEVLRDGAGVVTSIVLRNPWGVDGAGNDANPYDGRVAVTAAQLLQHVGQVNWGRV